MRALKTGGCALLALTSFAAAQEQVSVTLGLYSFKRPTDVYRQFHPASLELAKQTSVHLGRPVSITLVVKKTYEECLDEFVKGNIDVVRFGPASYVLAKQRQPKIQILAAELEDARGAGLIVVRKDSPLKTLEDLRRCRFAFGDSQSTIGRYLSQAELAAAGIHAGDLDKFAFLDRHDIVYKAVELGDYDAGALHIGTYKELNAKSDSLRVLHSFDNVPKPWLARAGLDAQLVTALKKGLLSVREPNALKALKVPGFSEATDKDFEVIRRGMELSRRFDPEPKADPAPVKEPAPSPAPGKVR